MRYFLILGLLLPLTASGIELEITILPGPGLDRLSAVCDRLKVEVRKPDMSADECGKRFLIMGAARYEYHQNLKDMQVLAAQYQALQDQLREDVLAEKLSFEDDLPMPLPGPTPTAAPE